MKIENKISIFGMWHLGTVISACCAEQYNIVAHDESKKTIEDLKLGILPIYEPELHELINDYSIEYTTDLEYACNHSNILWITYDTPVDSNNISDVDFVYNKIHNIISNAKNPSLILISSQLPVGTCKLFETQYPMHRFACLPENLRLGKSVSTFFDADRMIIGCRDLETQNELNSLFSRLNIPLVFMKTESAEMVKHALNSYLALSITFINEIASICETIGADAHEVSNGLKTDSRIGKNAYLNPGGPIAGGTLLRDVLTLENIGSNTPLLFSINKSNEIHKKWYINNLLKHFNLENKKIIILGATYTENTDTLRQSMMVSLYNDLKSYNANVFVYDPIIKKLPDSYSYINLLQSIENQQFDAIVLLTNNSSFKKLEWKNIINKDKSILFLDAGKFLYNELHSYENVIYKNVGI
jgi:UDPglucose 6-dehydrogenase